jgi:hypothetical protein
MALFIHSIIGATEKRWAWCIGALEFFTAENGARYGPAPSSLQWIPRATAAPCASRWPILASRSVDQATISPRKGSNPPARLVLHRLLSARERGRRARWKEGVPCLKPCPHGRASPGSAKPQNKNCVLGAPSTASSRWPPRPPPGNNSAMPTVPASTGCSQPTKPASQRAVDIPSLRPTQARFNWVKTGVQSRQQPSARSEPCRRRDGYRPAPG